MNSRHPAGPALDPTVVRALPEFAQFANTVADEARSTSLAYFRTRPELNIKPDGSPVTIADCETERVIRNLLCSAYPSHAVLGEEHGGSVLDQQYTWIIDPIDGTKSFLAGAPTYGMLLALLYDGAPVIGIIDIPVLDERWCGIFAQPTTLNGKPVRTSVCESIESAVLTIVSPNNFDAVEWRDVGELASKARVSRYSSDGYSHGLLASGYVDMVVAAGQQPFDYLAVVRVVEGAGGCISDWSGNPLDLDSDGRILVTATRELHEQALEIVGENGARCE